ncbi:flagellar motor switch protein FliG [Mesobaculum littorinae]|uniref:Flagellar motor switch protein FliG n=1 Tax=Mesobaculum littorinae TaxID=2486419 RepID=A0A438ADT9_9RHOB|nr:flagellar motor switch protein FliG [Mesobaculum littorinae]RVV96873.1 flagellar motor switch protein FliG [Mesobaculum littorinae]
MALSSLRRPERQKERRLSGAEKAAIVFLCLGEKRGSELMKRLDEREIQRITRAMTSLGVIEAGKVEAVMGAFSDAVRNGSGVVGSAATAETLLRGFLPEDQVTQLLADARGPAKETNMWAEFSALNETVIANYLRGEHDQTAAAILSNVAPDVAARVLPLLGPQRMEDIIERMISMEAVPQAMMRQIEETLKSDIMADASQPTSAELQQRMADLFNRLDRDLFDTLSTSLEERVPEPFNAIKQRMFTFDDLSKLDPSALAQIMRQADGDTLPLALRGAKKELRDQFLQALPQRSRDMLVEEMGIMGPVRGRDVRQAQSVLVDLAKDLAEQEIIRLPDSEDDELIE